MLCLLEYPDLVNSVFTDTTMLINFLSTCRNANQYSISSDEGKKLTQCPFTCLKSVRFSDDYDEELTLPLSLTSLTLGWKYNQVLILPSTLTSLTLGVEYNCVLTLPSTLTSLTLGYKYNQALTIPEGCVVHRK